MSKLFVVALVSLSFFGCAVESEEPTQEGPTTTDEAAVKGGKPICMLKCAAPPDGCHYENAVLSGPCNKLTCGTLVCDGSTL